MPADLPAWTLDRRRALGRRIQQLRIQADLTQERVIDRTGIVRSTFQCIEAGTIDPRYSTLLLIAQALEVPVEDLVREE